MPAFQYKNCKDRQQRLYTAEHGFRKAESSGPSNAVLAQMDGKSFGIYRICPELYCEYPGKIRFSLFAETCVHFEPNIHMLLYYISSIYQHECTIRFKIYTKPTSVRKRRRIRIILLSSDLGLGNSEQAMERGVSPCAAVLFIVDKKRPKRPILFQHSYEKVENCKNAVAIRYLLCYNHTGYKRKYYIDP